LKRRTAEWNASSHTSPLVSRISPLIVFLTPFGILEDIAYGIAISRIRRLTRLRLQILEPVIPIVKYYANKLKAGKLQLEEL
jgi:hypothetical protein